MHRLIPLAAVAAAALPVAAQTKPPAFTLSPAAARFASGPGNIAFLSLGVALPALEGRDADLRRTISGLALTTLSTEVLKGLVREPRPDGSDRRSFPSGHTAAAFAIAAARSRYRPGEALLWYAGAATIGQSRVVLNRHRPGDVSAGALLGVTIGGTAGGRALGLRLSF